MQIVHQIIRLVYECFLLQTRVIHVCLRLGRFHVDNLGRVWIEYAWPSVFVACKESLIDGLVRLIFWDTRDA